MDTWELQGFGENAPINAYPCPEGIPYQIATIEEFRGLPATPYAVLRRKQIYRLQEMLLDCAKETGDEYIATGPPPVHTFLKGLYTRQLTIPASQVVVSKRHAREHICIISKGSATVFTEDGITKVVAPYTFVSPAGSKRVLYVHEEIVWTTVHRTDATTVEEVEKDVLIDEPEHIWRLSGAIETEVA